MTNDSRMVRGADVSWIRYWSRPTATGAEGLAIDHVASDQFHEAGVDVGDWMYVITYRDGVLHVLTSLAVGYLVDREHAEEILGHTNLWEARWHVIARPETVRRATLAATLSDTETATIVFIGRDGRRASPARNRRGSIDPQTFRTVRRIDAPTAAMFRRLLEETDGTSIVQPNGPTLSGTNAEPRQRRSSSQRHQGKRP